jgi:succinate dehydrogenase / fumarate reductase flavoprotein subunit
VGKLTLSHLDVYAKAVEEMVPEQKRKAPIILPEYRGKEALARALDLL